MGAAVAVGGAAVAVGRAAVAVPRCSPPKPARRSSVRSGSPTTSPGRRCSPEPRNTSSTPATTIAATAADAAMIAVSACLVRYHGVGAGLKLQVLSLNASKWPGSSGSSWLSQKLSAGSSHRSSPGSFARVIEFLRLPGLESLVMAGQPVRIGRVIPEVVEVPRGSAFNHILMLAPVPGQMRGLPESGPSDENSHRYRRRHGRVRSPHWIHSPRRPGAVTSAPPRRLLPIGRFGNEKVCFGSLRGLRARPGGPDRVRPAPEGQLRRRDVLRRQSQRGDIRRGLRRDGRPRRGGQEGGRAQCDCPATGLGQLRRHHQGVLRQVRHQGQLGAARRRQPGRDQRRQPAEGQEHRAGRLRSGPVGGARQHLDVRAVQGRDVRRHPRGVQGPQRRLGQRLRRLHVDRIRLGQGATGHERQRSAQAGVQAARSRSTATPRRPALRSPAC